MKSKVTTSEATQAPPFLSQAILTGQLIFVSGQIHTTPDGKLVAGSTEQKLDLIMRNIQAILKAGGADLNNIVKATIYLTDISELKNLNQVYPKYFSDPFPAREAICVKALPLGASIEISVIAVKNT